MRRNAAFSLLTAGFVAVTLAGCGLANTTTAAATGAASEVQQAQQAKATLDEVKQQLDAAARQDAQRREQADKDSQ